MTSGACLTKQCGVGGEEGRGRCSLLDLAHGGVNGGTNATFRFRFEQIFVLLQFHTARLGAATRRRSGVEMAVRFEEAAAQHEQGEG